MIIHYSCVCFNFLVALFSANTKFDNNSVLNKHFFSISSYWGQLYIVIQKWDPDIIPTGSKSRHGRNPDRPKSRHGQNPNRAEILTSQNPDMAEISTGRNPDTAEIPTGQNPDNMHGIEEIYSSIVNLHQWPPSQILHWKSKPPLTATSQNCCL